MKTIVVIAGPIALFGIAGTPDYVLDIERENETLRTELKRTTLALNRARLVSAECGLDEIAPEGKTHVAELRYGEIRSYAVTPADFSASAAGPPSRAMAASRRSVVTKASPAFFAASSAVEATRAVSPSR